MQSETRSRALGSPAGLAKAAFPGEPVLCPSGTPATSSSLIVDQTRKGCTVSTTRMRPQSISFEAMRSAGLSHRNPSRTGVGNSDGLSAFRRGPKAVVDAWTRRGSSGQSGPLPMSTVAERTECNRRVTNRCGFSYDRVWVYLVFIEFCKRPRRCARAEKQPMPTYIAVYTAYMYRI